MSTVFRVVKNSNYTTLSNYHFKDKRLSWKAKGLLSTMLSLPDDWNYTIEGLSKLSADGIKATNSGLLELERCGYLDRKQTRNENGHFGLAEYYVYEQPTSNGNTMPEEDREKEEAPLCRNGQTVENTAFPPLCQKRQTEKRISEKGGQLNTNILNTKESNTYQSSSVSNPLNKDQAGSDEEGIRRQHFRERLLKNHLYDVCQSEIIEAVFGELSKREEGIVEVMTAEAVERICLVTEEQQKREPDRRLPELINSYIDNIVVGIRAAPKAEMYGERSLPQAGSRSESDRKMDEREAYKKLIRKNIEYECLIRNQKYGRKEKIDELVELMLDILCTGRQTVCIAGDDCVSESVKARFLMLRSDHIEYVLSSMEKTTTKIRNIKKYLLAALYNAPVTIDNYYSMLVNHEIHLPDNNGR